MMLSELLQKRKVALDKADKILKACEEQKRGFNEQEQCDVDACTVELEAIGPQIAAIEKLNTLRAKQTLTDLLPAPPSAHNADAFKAGTPYAKMLGSKKTFSVDYFNAFHMWAANGFVMNPEIQAAMVEGTNSAGGFAVPLTVDGQIVPLAPQEFALRRLARVIPTTMDIKFPVKLAHGTAAAKAETSSFGGTAPTLTQFTLSAFMAGDIEDISWELAQDVPAFQAFLQDDLILAQQTYEEDKFVNGSGSGEPQGLIGNVDAGVAAGEPDSNSNLVTITGTLDVIGTLNAVYHGSASWLMQRATSIVLRKAQIQANLFFPAWSRVGDQDFLHGYPVEYSTAMPSCSRGNTPIIFGDFSRGYIIGDRGGSGINIKVLDQPKASQGLLTLLAYRRTDGRVRRAEALKSYRVALS